MAAYIPLMERLFSTIPPSARTMCLETYPPGIEIETTWLINYGLDTYQSSKLGVRMSWSFAHA